jgi:hypothetical protein
VPLEGQLLERRLDLLPRGAGPHPQRLVQAGVRREALPDRSRTRRACSSSRQHGHQQPALDASPLQSAQACTGGQIPSFRSAEVRMLCLLNRHTEPRGLRRCSCSTGCKTPERHQVRCRAGRNDVCVLAVGGVAPSQQGGWLVQRCCHGPHTMERAAPCMLHANHVAASTCGGKHAMQGTWRIMTAAGYQQVPAALITAGRQARRRVLAGCTDTARQWRALWLLPCD